MKAPFGVTVLVMMLIAKTAAMAPLVQVMFFEESQ
jgi:hypothetical protein